MAKNFSAELLIGTAQARKDLTAMRGQVQALDQSLAALSKTLKTNQGDLDRTASAIGSIVASSRSAAQASESLAKAKILESRAAANVNSATDKHAESLAREAATYARANKEAAQAIAIKQRVADAQERSARTAHNAAASQDALGNSLSNTRYLLYDVGATYRTMAIGLQALPAASLAVAAAYEKDFAQVIRTTGETSVASEGLRKELKQLATEIPLSFAELSNIAMIGGQMDIASKDLGAFTETVAKFIATSDGVTIDSATQAFGRLANLFNTDLNGNTIDPEFFNKIGSAISFTADRSVTSEKAITAMMTKMAAVGKQAGMSATDVTALASALTSVGIQPELGSGFVTRLFGNLNKSVAAGGDKLREYAGAIGMTSDEFKKLYQTNPNEVLNRILETMQGMTNVQQTSFLGTMGISATRDQRVVQALAAQLHVLKDAQADVNDAFGKGTYLDTSSNAIFSTFAANLQKLGSALMNVGDSLGRSVLPILTPIVEGLAGLAQGFSSLLEDVPALRGLIGVLMTFGGVVGVILAVKSAQAFLTAGMIGFQHVAQQGTGAALSFKGQMTQLAATMLATKGASAELGASIISSVGPVRALGLAATTSSAQLQAMSVAQVSAATTGRSFGSALKGIGASALGMVGGLGGLTIGAVVGLATAFISASSAAKQAAQDIASTFQQGAAAGLAAQVKYFTETRVAATTAGSSLGTLGKTFLDVAKDAGISMEDIAKATAGGAEGVAQLRARLAELDKREGGALKSLDPGNVGYDISVLDKYLAGLQDKLGTNARAADETAGAQNALGGEFADTAMDADSAGTEVEDYTKKLNDAVAAAFGMVDAQGAVNASLEKLGAGLVKSSSFGTGSGEGRDNLANLQSTLAAQALLLQQNIQAGKMSAETAAQTYGDFVSSLMGQLISNGVDPAQIQGIVANAKSGVLAEFGAQEPVAMPMTVDTTQFADELTVVFGELHAWLQDNTLTANMDLSGADETMQNAYATIQYIAELTGMPFEAVVTAFTDPASAEASTVATYMQQLMGMDYRAVINADTSAAVANVSNFQRWAGAVLAGIGATIANTGANIGNLPGMGALGAAAQGIGNNLIQMGAGMTVAAPVDQMAKSVGQLPPAFKRAAVAASDMGKRTKQAVQIPKPDLASLGKGFNDAAKSANKAGKAAGGAGKKAKGAGKAAKGAGNAAKKAGDDAAKGAQKAAKEWDAAEQAISGFASRVGNAFQYVFDKTQGIQVAKDEYYSTLNGIRERLEQQKQTIRDLRVETASLNAERNKELIDADKLEQMAKLAEKHGNGGRAKDYRAEAAELKASAREKQNKISTNEKEIKTIERGTGNLKGYTQAAIDNRAELRSLEKAGLNVAEAYAKSGASARAVKDATIEWTNKARTHGIQLGYNARDVGNVTTKTDAYIKKLARVPKTIATNVTQTTTYKAKNSAAPGVSSAKRSLGSLPSSKSVPIYGANKVKSGVQAAQRELNKLKSKSVSIVVTGIKGTTLRATGNRTSSGQPVYRVYSNGRATNQQLFNKGGRVPQPQGFASGGKIPGKAPSNPNIDNLMASVDGLGQVMVRSGEYIQSQPAVNYYGEDIMDKINQMKLPRFALGGMMGKSTSSENSGTQLVDLTAEAIQGIARALVAHPTYLFADGEKLADTVNRGQTLIAQKGGSRHG